MTSLHCSFTTCLEKDIGQDDSRIEVQTALSSGGVTKMKSKLLVNWSAEGDACFHVECWTALLKNSRARSKKNMTLPKMIDMEKSLIKEAAKTCEKHDATDVFLQEGKIIAEMIKKSKHCVCFTGAGISTSAGIGDYRGKSGKWTEMDREKFNVDSMIADDDQETPVKRARLDTENECGDEEETESDGVPYEKLRPTYTHEALAKLMSDGHLKYCISQNGDGLHLLSGLQEERISELHGNVFIEKCEKCDERYQRTYYVMDDEASQYYEDLEDNGGTDIKKPSHAKRCDLCGLSHRTGRRCDRTTKGGKVCGGQLMDTIINFRDNLEEAILDRAIDNAKKCDLMLCLGTTLTVTPASSLVEMGNEPLKIVICNRQTTYMDAQALQSDTNGGHLGSRVFGDCDRLFKKVMRELYSEQNLKDWEEARRARMEVYDELRKE